MQRLVRASIRHRKLVLALWGVVLAVSAVLALQLDSSLSAGGFSNPRGEAIIAQTTVQEAFGEAPNQVVVALESDSAIAANDLEAVARVLRDSGATQIVSPSERPEWLTGDGTTAVVLAGFDGSNSAVQDLTPELMRDLEAATDVTAYVTGQPALDYRLNVHSKEDAIRAELIVFPILIVILLLVFRSVAAAATPLVIAGGALLTGSAIGFVATQFTEISILYSNIVSMIGLAVAVDYSLFIVKRYREELDAGRPGDDALTVAFATAGRSVLFSGIAVAVALSALFIPRLMAFTSIALGGIVVTAVALLLAVTALPALLSLLGPRISWGAIPLRRRPASTAGRAVPRVYGVIGIVALVALAVPIAGISLQSPVASATVLPKDDPARVGLELIESRIGNDGLFPIQVLLSAPAADGPESLLDQVGAFTDFAEDQPSAATVVSPTSNGAAPADLAALLASGEAPPALSALWAQNGDELIARVLVTSTGGPDSVEAHELVQLFREEGAPGGADLRVTGATAQGLDFDQALIASIPWIVLFVFILTFAMLAAAFRSALLPLVALVFNVLVVGASLGALTLISGALGSAPINSVTPVLLFAVMFGLSMDYMVIIVSRIIEHYRAGEPFAEAVAAGTRSTRAMINSAAIIMVAVFAAFGTAQISIVREIGIGLGIAVLLDALLIRVVVMPAILTLVGPRVLGRRAMAEHGRANERFALDPEGAVSNATATERMRVDA